MIACSPLSGQIFSGRTNREGTAFVGFKKDVTSDVLRAIIEKAQYHGGDFLIRGSTGSLYRIDVTCLAEEPKPGAAADFKIVG